MTCATCTSFRPATDGSAVGTCATGGPDPKQGCSDVHRDETCQRWEERRRAWRLET